MRWGAIVLIAACRFAPQDARVDGAPGDDAAIAPDVPRGATGKRVKLGLTNARNEDLIDFPLLVVLDSTRVSYADFAADGSDIRFFDADGTTPLPYEIETWAPTDHSYLWVRVPQIDKNTSADFVWMVYGDASLPRASGSVWSTDYAGVWHLDEDPGGGGTFTDATAQHDATATANMLASEREPGQIGTAIHFHGTAEDIHLAAGLPLTRYTWSLWLNADTAPNQSQGNNDVISDGDVNFNFCWSHNQVAFTAAAAQNDGAWHPAAIQASLQGQTWYHVASTYDGAKVCVYLDGGTPRCSDSNTPLAPTGSFAIGAAHVGTATNTFPGLVDEVHVERVVRSTAWLDAEHASGADQMIVYNPPEPE